MAWLIAVKLAINLGIAAHYFRTHPPVSLMFAGFVLADAGSLWLLITGLK
jgi:hypothetical protein